MKLGFFPGCSAHGTARELNESLATVAGALDLVLEEVEDWACCGATSAHSTNHLLGVALPARTLAIAEKQGLKQVMSPCAACFSRLATARHEIQENVGLAQKIQGILDRPFRNSVGVRNIVDVFQELIPTIKEKVVKPLAGLKVACYYGCLLVRPVEAAQFDDAEQPTAMEEVVRALGGEPVEFSHKLVCCGGSLFMSSTGSVIRLGQQIISSAKAAGADVVVVACPLCHSNLDFRQEAMLHRGEPGLPVLYLAQLTGLALGIDPDKLGLWRHFVSAQPLLRRLAGAPAPARKEA